jgi:hypothetical protein
MAYTTNQLISGAYYASGVVAREFETVSGNQISDGLGWLNDILTEKRVDDGMIPYETKYSFIAQTGVETYFIPNLISIDTLVFYLDEVRYAMVYTKRNQYFGSPRVENINTLPYEWYFERKVGGGNLHIYFKPDRNYAMEVHGAFGLNTVSLGENLLSNTTIANLGVPTFFGTGVLNPGQLVITTPSNSTTKVVDLMGVYPNIGALINYINSGIIPGVQANIEVNDFVLSSTTSPPIAIYVRTDGYPPNGTRFIGNVAAATTASLNATYSNGTNGIGATLTSNVNAVLTIDGYAVQLNDRVLVKNQDVRYNGSYSLTTLGTVSVPWVLTRTTNYDQPVEIEVGDLFTVVNGTVNAGLTYVQLDEVSTIGNGTDDSAIEFSVFNAISFSNFSTIGNPLYEVFNSGGFDQFYLTYLRYCLADRICAEYQYDTPPNVIRQLQKYESWINKKSKLIDLEMVKQSTLQKRGSFNYAFVNLGKGWTKPG